MKKVHFMGIAGSGMNAVAGIAQSLGYEVSGCDFAGKPNEYTGSLEASGIHIDWNHDANHLNGIEILCVTPAVFDLSSQEPEFVQAKERGIQVMTWQEFMGKELQKGKKVIAIAGTKGKSTTTALTGVFMEKAGLDPIVEVGGKVLDWNRNYRLGHSDYFICEADEFNNNYLNYKPEYAILTNIIMDHPEFFGSFDEYMTSFERFIRNIRPGGTLIVNNDDDNIRNLIYRVRDMSLNVVRYGMREDSDICLLSQLHISKNPGFQEFIIKGLGAENTVFNTALLGYHNVFNSLAVISLAKCLNISPEPLTELFKTFKGVGRRMELLGEVKGAKVFNDYAHHPIAVRETLTGVRLKYPDAKVWAIYQPHMYSRTKLLLDDFGKAFKDADVAILCDIFASREKGKPIEKEVSSQMIVDKISEFNRDSGRSQDVRYLPKNEIPEVVYSELESGDVVVNMGAGDNSEIAEKLCKMN